MELPKSPAPSSPKPIVIVYDKHRASFVVVAMLYDRLFKKMGLQTLLVPTPTDEKQREQLEEKYPEHIVLHITQGRNFIPIPWAYNIACPAHEWSRYPQPWIRQLDRFEELWVESHHILDVLRRSGLETPIYWIPESLENEHIVAKTNWEAAKPFKFLFCGEPHFRKGHHLLIEGFTRAFPKPGVATLTIKTTPKCTWDAPREDIQLLKLFVEPQEWLRYYAQFDAYVSASLAEGLGLPIAEAILAGLPIAANFWGGHRDLVCNNGFWEINHRVVDQPFCSISEYYSPGQQCALSDPDQIAIVLHKIVFETTTEERKKQAQLARKALLESYGDTVCASRAKERLKAIEQHMHKTLSQFSKS